MTKTTSGCHHGHGRETHWSNNTAQLVNVDGETAGAIVPRCLRTQSDDASTMLRTLESVLQQSESARAATGEVRQNHELVRRRLRSSSTSFLSRCRRRRRSSWSGWAPSFVVVMLCVVNCSGSGGEVSAFWMSRLVHILREVTTRTPLWLFYQWVIFQLLSFSGENAWQNHYGSHHHIKGSEQSGYLSEHLKTPVFNEQ